jgi:hypothetical protein
MKFGGGAARLGSAACEEARKRLPAMVSDLLTRRMRAVQFEGARLRLGRRVLTGAPTEETVLVLQAMRARSWPMRGIQRGCGLRATLGRLCLR